MSFSGPLFVIGFPRSGTSLLRSLLNEHSRISIPKAESEMLPYWVAHWAEHGDLSDRAAFDAFFVWCQTFTYFRGRARRLGKGVDADAWFDAITDFGPAGVFEAVVRENPKGGQIWGDKSPGYTDQIVLLNELFPRARYVHIIRDVRDVSLSARRAWGKSMVRHAQRWSDRVGAAREQSAVVGNRYLEVSFENLTCDPERELRRVCNHVGVPYESGMTELSEPSEKVGTAMGETRVVASVAQRWRRDMSSKERHRIETVAGARLVELQYELPDGLPTQRRLSAVRLWAFKGYDIIQIVRNRLKKWGLRDLMQVGPRLWKMQREGPGS